MVKVNVYTSPYHWELTGFEEYVYLYPWRIIKKYLHTDAVGVDIGCGDCRITSILANTMRKVYGIDNQIEPLQFGQKLVKAESLTLLNADCLQLPFKSLTFDVVFMFDVIEHVPFDKLHTLINEIRRILKVKGFVILTTPNRKNTLRSRGKISEKHYFELSYKEILNLIESHDLKTVEFKGVYPRPPLKKLHRYIKKRKYLYVPLIECGKWFPDLCDTFVVIAQH